MHAKIQQKRLFLCECLPMMMIIIILRSVYYNTVKYIFKTRTKYLNAFFRIVTSLSVGLC